MRFLIALMPLYLVGQSPSPMIRAKQFPPPDFVLHDTIHKEPPSGVQLGPGGITIQQGVGTPTTINVLAFSGDGKVLAAGKDFGRVVVWDFPSRSVAGIVETGQGIVSAVALNDDGTILATGGNGDKFSVKLWNVTTGKVTKTFKLGQDFVKDVRFDSLGRWVAVTYNQGRAYVIDSTTGSPVLELTRTGTHAMRFSKDGTMLLTGDAFDFTTWNTGDWSKRQSAPRGQGGPLLLAFHALSNRIAVERDFRVRIALLSTGEVAESVGDLLPDARANPFLPFSEFSTDGSILFLTLKDRLWLLNTRTGTVCGSNVMYSSGGALSPNGRWLVGSKDDSILSKERTDGVWVWDTEKLATDCGMTPSVQN